MCLQVQAMAIDVDQDQVDPTVVVGATGGHAPVAPVAATSMAMSTYPFTQAAEGAVAHTTQEPEVALPSSSSHMQRALKVK